MSTNWPLAWCGRPGVCHYGVEVWQTGGLPLRGGGQVGEDAAVPCCRRGHPGTIGWGWVRRQTHVLRRLAQLVEVALKSGRAQLQQQCHLLGVVPDGEEGDQLVQIPGGVAQRRTWVGGWRPAYNESFRLRGAKMSINASS